MKYSTHIIPLAIGATLFGLSAFAQNDFQNSVLDGTYNDYMLTEAGNWSGGLPDTSGNAGDWDTNINGAIVNGLSTTLFITQTNGTLTSDENTSSMVLDGGAYTLDGGTWNVFRAFRLNNSQTLTVNSGSMDLGTRVTASVNDGSTFTMNGGTLLNGNNRGLVGSGGTVTVNGGSITVGGLLGVGNTGQASDFIFNGGTTSAPTIGFGLNNDGTQFIFGGTTAGSVTADAFALNGGTVAQLRDRVDIDWLSGSLMTLSVTADDSGLNANWAQDLWDYGAMTYNGSGVGTLGDWTVVTTTGFGDGAGFSFDEGTGSLSLVAIPEPSSIALIGLAALAGFIVKRRR